MKHKITVGVLLAILTIDAIIIAVSALREPSYNSISKEEYEENIRMLNDTIRILKDDIAKYKVEIERIDLERRKIRAELDIIIRDNEKIDIELANGDWDTNIKFLADFLSKEDSVE